MKVAGNVEWDIFWDFQTLWGKRTLKNFWLQKFLHVIIVQVHKMVAQGLGIMIRQKCQFWLGRVLFLQVGSIWLFNWSNSQKQKLWKWENWQLLLSKKHEKYRKKGDFFCCITRKYVKFQKNWIFFCQIAMFVLISLCNQRIFTKKFVKFFKKWKWLNFVLILPTVQCL